MDHVPRTTLGIRLTSEARIGAYASIAAFALALVWLALVQHTVGDYGPESDFYGGYAEGARAIQRGLWDARRYVVVGPLYEALLAWVGRVLPDLFTTAKLISVVSAVGAVALWYALLARLVGAWPSLWALALLVVNPTFLRYGYAASTDMLAVFLQSACVFAWLGSRARVAPFLAGVLAGLAVLTRYSAIALVPGMFLAHWLRPEEGRPKASRWAMAAAGLLVVIGPWLVFSLGHGVVPGEGLLRGYAFYADDRGTWNVQDVVRAAGDAPPKIPGWRAVVSADPRGYLASRLREIPDHLHGDARHLLGWPSALVIALGLAIGFRHVARRRLFPVAAFGAPIFAVLLGAFHSSRYSLPLVLFYATGATGLAMATSSHGISRSRRGLIHATGVGAVALTAVAAIRAQSDLRREIPREVVDAGRSLAQTAIEGVPVIGRKGHIGYYSGHPVVPLPRLRTLRELGDYARSRGARFLYFSWYETQVRPELAYLLDTTSAIPGLTVVHMSHEKPAVLYRIGPEFGRPPDWIANDFLKSLHVARALVEVQGDQAPTPHHVVLAVDALLRQAWPEAVHHASLVVAADSTHALAWAVEGEALRRLARFDDARMAFLRAIDLDPADPAAKIGLGRIELASGNALGAMRLWRAAAGHTEDVRTLGEISRLLGAVSDTSGVRDIQRAMERIERQADPPDRSAVGLPPACQRFGALAFRARRSGSL